MIGARSLDDGKQPKNATTSFQTLNRKCMFVDHECYQKSALIRYCFLRYRKYKKKLLRYKPALL